MIEIFTTSAKRESGKFCLTGNDLVTIRLTDDEGRSIVRTVTGGEWSKLIANPRQT